MLASTGTVPLTAREWTLEHVDRVESLLLGQLARADGHGSSAWEVNLAAQLRRVRGDSPGPGLDELGPRVAEIIGLGQRFRRDVVAALDFPDPRVAVDAVVDAYLAHEGLAFPAAPKTMDVLYDHDAALSFRSRYPELKGVLWAGRWVSLAFTEPFTDLAAGLERDVGLDTVTARYRAKLDADTPPHGHPSELPLAPAIAPGLVWVSPEAAMIWDNHSLFVEVVADILAAPGIEDRATGLAAAADFFTDPELALTPQLTWETMALRHGIFFQGGYPLALMTENERNVNGHGAHMQRGATSVIPGMGRTGSR